MRDHLLDALDWLRYWLYAVAWVASVLILTAIMLWSAWDFLQRLNQGDPQALWSLVGVGASGLLLYRMHQYKDECNCDGHNCQEGRCHEAD